MLQTLKNAWRTKEIRTKIIFTLVILAIYRVGTVLPVPFVDAHDFSSSFQGTILDYMNVLSGGTLGTATFFALGVSPYINASIILQLLGVVFPNSIGAMAKNDKEKMGFVTRIVTVALAIVTAIGYYFLLAENNLSYIATKGNASGDVDLFWFYGIVIVTCYVAGAMLIMWLADRINEHGIGNGISVILFANIISVLPSQLYKLIAGVIIPTFSYNNGPWYSIVSILFAVLYIAIMVASVIFVIFITGSERRIPVNYAKRNRGRKMYGGQSTHIPIKLNMTGVMPVIFASSIVSLLPTVFALCGVTGEAGANANGWEKFINGFASVIGQDGVIYPIVFFVMIIGFAYFYTQITFNPTEVANNLNMQGGAIPGIRQGRPTANYIGKILNKITLAGALFLSIIAVVPIVIAPHVVKPILEWVLNGAITPEIIAANTAASLKSAYESNAATASSLASVFSFGGTSLIIVVGVALETFRALEAQLTMRSYKGFLN